jgi:hypothetical protein
LRSLTGGSFRTRCESHQHGVGSSYVRFPLPSLTVCVLIVPVFTPCSPCQPSGSPRQSQCRRHGRYCRGPIRQWLRRRYVPVPPAKTHQLTTHFMRARRSPREGPVTTALEYPRTYRSKPSIQCAFQFSCSTSHTCCPTFFSENPVEVTPSDQPPEGQGLIGLGPSSRSQIIATLQGSTSDPPLDNTFRLDMLIPNLITPLLNRKSDTTEQYTDDFIITKILP